MSRLPTRPLSTDTGYIYVVRREEAYKVGFSRKSVPRRVKTADGQLVLTIRTGQMPSTLEHLIHHRFKDKRTTGPGSKREWFALDADDLAWLCGLEAYLKDITYP